MGNLRLEGIVKRYGTIEALSGVDLDIRDGELFVLLGPSAAGKTTTLRVIAGLETAEAGRVVFDGTDLAGVPVQHRDMAMVFQSFALYPHLTTRQNLAYPLRETKLSRAETKARVQETAEMLRITHTLDRRPASLSGGEQQRLAIGRAIIRKPKLFLFDEPLTNLDAKLRHDMRAEFKRLHQELGTTTVYATPDQLEALSMAERIGILDRGRVVQVGTPAELYEAPRDFFVAQLVGDPPMNLIPGVRRGANGAASLELPFLRIEQTDWTEKLALIEPGTKLLFGIRPHDLHLVGADSSGLRFAAEIEITEPQGDITILDLKANGTTLRLVVPEAEGAQYSAGDAVQVGLDPRDARLFLEDSGVMIG